MKQNVYTLFYRFRQSDAFPPPYLPAFSNPFPDTTQSNVQIRPLAPDANSGVDFWVEENGRRYLFVCKNTNTKPVSFSFQLEFGSEKGSPNQARLISAGIIKTCLRVLVRSVQLQSMIGDLQERAIGIAERSGFQAAQRWYLRQLLGSIPSLLWAAIRRVSGLQAILERIGR
jgi:hypothetical protein